MASMYSPGVIDAAEPMTVTRSLPPNLGSEDAEARFLAVEGHPFHGTGEPLGWGVGAMCGFEGSELHFQLCGLWSSDPACLRGTGEPLGWGVGAMCGFEGSELHFQICGLWSSDPACLLSCDNGSGGVLCRGFAAFGTTPLLGNPFSTTTFLFMLQPSHYRFKPYICWFEK